MMKDYRTSTEKARWSVKLERSTPTLASELRKRHQAPGRFRGVRVFVMSTFLFHLFVYGVIMMMLLGINLATWSGFLWMAIPAVAWGAGVAIHGGFAWMIANIGVARTAVEKAQQPVTLPRVKPKAPADINAAELHTLLGEGLDKVDAMRAIGRRMTSPGARSDAMHAVNAIENTLVALEGEVDEVPLARDFVSRLIEPAHRLFVEYDRLARRDIQGAKALLQQVEQHDLPQITRKAEDVHDRIHRGTMIDLEVAREMLSLSDRTTLLDD